MVEAGNIPASILAGVVVVAVVDTLGAPLCADVVGQGLGELGDVGRDVVLADARVDQRVLWAFVSQCLARWTPFVGYVRKKKEGAAGVSLSATLTDPQPLGATQCRARVLLFAQFGAGGTHRIAVVLHRGLGGDAGLLETDERALGPLGVTPRLWLLLDQPGVWLVE